MNPSISKGSWKIFGDESATLAQWRRARDWTNLDYPQVPGSILAENLSNKKWIWIWANKPSSKVSKILFPVIKSNKFNSESHIFVGPFSKKNLIICWASTCGALSFWCVYRSMFVHVCAYIWVFSVSCMVHIHKVYMCIHILWRVLYGAWLRVCMCIYGICASIWCILYGTSVRVWMCVYVHIYEHMVYLVWCMYTSIHVHIHEHIAYLL